MQPTPRSLESVALPRARLARAKRSFNTRRLMPASARRLLRGDLVPCVGDFVLARVESVGHHKKLQLPSGCRTELFVGDEIVVVFGDRYAPNQWEARIPEDLGPCQLAAAGGLASHVLCMHPKMNEPTQLQPLGLLADSRGRRLNLAQLSLQDPGKMPAAPPTIVVVGTSMDSGKTTSAAAVVLGLTRAGMRVGAVKVTGTGACGDLIKFKDSGSVHTLDFVDAGLPTTFLQPQEEIERVVRTLVAAEVENKVEALVIEIADGLLQEETSKLLRSPVIRALNAGFVFAATDAISALEGERMLRTAGHDVRAISGIITASPLSTHEIEHGTGTPVLGRDALAEPATALELMGLKRRRIAMTD